MFVIFKKEDGKHIKIGQYTGDYNQIKDVVDEPLISDDPELAKLMIPDPITPKNAYNYAQNVIEGRWPEGEETIRTDPQWAYHYARYVIKGKWPEAEPIIMTNPEYAYRYADFVGRWPVA